MICYLMGWYSILARGGGFVLSKEGTAYSPFSIHLKWWSRGILIDYYDDDNNGEVKNDIHYCFLQVFGLILSCCLYVKLKEYEDNLY